jgi:hypothetical protein
MKTLIVCIFAISSAAVVVEMLRVLSNFNRVSLQGDLATGVSFWGTTLAMLGLSGIGFLWSIRWIYKRRNVKRGLTE